MNANIRQPLLGIIATVVAVGGSMLFVIMVDPLMMGTWLTLIVTALVPLQFLVAVTWRQQWPAPIAGLPQPARGLAFTVLFALFGALVSWLVVILIGGGITPPNPVPITFVIYAVQIAIWVIIGFGGWPASLIKSPSWRSLATLGMIYAITFVLFRVLFNFSHIEHAPFYVPALDPHGAFVAWGPVTFTMATVGALLTLVYFDMEPFSTIAERYPRLAAQPVFGLLLLGFSALVGGGIWFIGTRVLKMDLVIFLARCDVAYVFGILMVINLFQMGKFVALPQPLRGIVLTAVTLLLAVVIVPIFQVLSTLAFGPLASGPPTYDFELWVASALLAITFPFISLYSRAFDFWPFGSPGDTKP